jgi:D-beta-D-heptose 7-phosphate kinase/D-beta-D-heptose 1-phosphate adenosyltransferase
MKNKDDNIVLITGGFDPLHSGHISLIKEARKLGRVIIGLNSDEWLTRKKGIPFQKYGERYEILSNLKDILCVLKFNDADGSAIDAIDQCKKMFPKSQIVFANGGDRTSDNIPEFQYCKDNQVDMVFEVGGSEKKNSSSWILSNWISNNYEDRFWGKFKTLYTNGDKIKIKELIVEPQKSISLQKHQFRNEYWIIISGTAKIQIEDTESLFYPDDFLLIEPGILHKMTNVGTENLKILEVQHGKKCDESDIERF